MNIRLQKAVLAALAVGVAGSASAIDISTVPAANVIYSSGSTAIEAALRSYWFNSTDASTPCDSTQGSIDVYSAGAGSKFTAVACMSNTSYLTASSTSVPIAIIKESTAGSLNGVSALQNIAFSGSPSSASGATVTGGVLPFPVITTLTTTICGVGTATTGTGLQPYINHTCTGFTGTFLLPELGFSDVEGTLFAGTDPTTPVALNSGATVQVVFAPAVSLGLYHALQAVEGKTVGSEAVADMPSLTRAQLSTIFSGKVPTSLGWNWLANSAGAAVGGQTVLFGGATGNCFTGATTGTTYAACTAPGTTAFAPANANVYICRRGANSGSEVSAEIFLNDYHCGAGTNPFATISTLQCTTAATDGCAWTQASSYTKVVFAGNGTGDLIDCLNGHDSAGHFAIGFASTDNLSGASQSKASRRDFRYIKVDDVVPSIENAAAGKYQFVAQSLWYTPPSGAVNDPATEGKAIAAALVGQMAGSATQGVGTVGSAIGVNGASVNSAQGFDGGVLVIPGQNGAVPTSASDTTTHPFSANPVSAVWKTGGATTNNCVRTTYYPTAPTSAVDGAAVWQTP